MRPLRMSSQTSGVFSSEKRLPMSFGARPTQHTSSLSPRERAGVRAPGMGPAPVRGPLTLTLSRGEREKTRGEPLPDGRGSDVGKTYLSPFPSQFVTSRAGGPRCSRTSTAACRSSSRGRPARDSTRSSTSSSAPSGSPFRTPPSSRSSCPSRDREGAAKRPLANARGSSVLPLAYAVLGRVPEAKRVGANLVFALDAARPAKGGGRTRGSPLHAPPPR